MILGFLQYAVLERWYAECHPVVVPADPSDLLSEFLRKAQEPDSTAVQANAMLQFAQGNPSRESVAAPLLEEEVAPFATEVGHEHIAIGKAPARPVREVERM